MRASQSEVPTPLRTEILAGITTFFTMAYIVVVNPAILATEGTGLPFSGVMTATVLICFSMTLLMGLYAKLPFAVAPGMGINAFFTYTVVLGQGVPWQTALGMVFWSGVLFVLISVTPLREAIAMAIPASLRVAAAGGIGLLLTFIGLKNAGIVVSHPVTFVQRGELGAEALICLLSLGLIVFVQRRMRPVAFLAGMVAATLAGLVLGLAKAPERVVSAPDFDSVLFQLDFAGALAPALIPTVVALLFTDLFDSISTFLGVGVATGLTDSDGRPKRLREGLIVDAFATLTAGLFGSSSGTAYVESAAGIEAGGRSGRTAVVTALCFLPCLFLAPLAGMVPAFATAPVLIFVGALMFRSLLELRLQGPEELVPVFLTACLIPLTFSITQGILWGFISHVGLFALAGRRREVEPAMWGIAALSVALLLLDHG